MTDPELLEAFLDGELDEAGWSELELLVSAMPGIAPEMAFLRLQGQALAALLGDGSAEARIKGAVLGDLRGRSLEDLKTDVLERVRAEEDRRRREETAALPVLPAPRGEGVAEGPARKALRPRRARWPWAVAAAAGFLAAAVALLRSPSEGGAGSTGACLLDATPDVRVLRSGIALPGGADMPLEEGDRILVAEGGGARVGFTIDPTRLALEGPAEFCLARGGRQKRGELLRGRLEALVAPGTEGDPLVLVTPFSETRLADGHVRLSCANGFARLEVRRGWALLRRVRDGQAVRVGTEQYAVVDEGRPLVALALAGEDRPAAVPPRPVVAVLARVQGDVYRIEPSIPQRKRAEAGRGLVAGEGLATEGAASLAVVEYPDGTRVEVGADTTVGGFAPPEGPPRRLVTLDRGILTADVVRNPADGPMELLTPHAAVRVLGTRFVLAAEKEATRVQVEEGAVRFTHLGEGRSVEVRSGFFGVAGEGIFQVLPIPGGARYLDVDLGSGRKEGDGVWVVDGRSVRQADPRARGAVRLFRAESDRGILVESSVRVDPVEGEGAWGFGLVAGFGPRRLGLRSLQEGEGGSVFEFQDLRGLPFAHGRGGVFRLKWQVERRREAPALLRGKIWQGEREPDGWMIEGETVLEGPLTEVGLQVVRCACTFSRFRVEILRDDLH